MQSQRKGQPGENCEKKRPREKKSHAGEAESEGSPIQIQGRKKAHGIGSQIPFPVVVVSVAPKWSAVYLCVLA